MSGVFDANILGKERRIAEMKLACAGCRTLLEISPDIATFACAKCGVTQQVDRQGGIVTLKFQDAADQPPPLPPVAKPPPLPSRREQQSGMSPAAKIALGIFCVLVVLGLFGTYGPPAKEKPINEDDARLMCRIIVEKRLDDPSSVQWIDRYKWPTRQTAPRQFTVWMEYRAKNVFGGLVLKSTYCEVKADTESRFGNWTLIKLSEY